MAKKELGGGIQLDIFEEAGDDKFDVVPTVIAPDIGYVKRTKKKGKSIQERFEAFHQDNPEVYNAIVAKAREAKERGFEEYSICAIYEIVRWEMWVELGRREHFKLSNSYRSRYSRLIMSQEPDLAGFFPTRDLISD